MHVTLSQLSILQSRTTFLENWKWKMLYTETGKLEDNSVGKWVS
jgi:hypothetical protein